MMVSPQLAANNKIAEICAALDANPTAINLQADGGLFDGRTLLMIAAARGHAELVAVLLQRGADATIVGKRNETAESLALAQGHAQIAATLTTAAARGPATAAPAAEERSSNTGNGAKASRVQPPSATALAQMAQLGNSKLLAALDVDPDAINRPCSGGLFDGRTLLMCAASRGHTTLVSELLRRGADPSVQGRLGVTAEALARKQGHEQVADLIAARVNGPKPTVATITAAAIDGAANSFAAAASTSTSSRAAGKRQREENAQVDGPAPPASKLRATAPPFVPSSEAPVTTTTVDGAGTPSVATRCTPSHVTASAAGDAPATSSSTTNLEMKVHVASQTGGAAELLLHSVSDAERASLRSALDALGRKRGGAVTLRLIEPKDAAGKPMDPGADVFSLWLEHGDSGDGDFDTELRVWCRAQREDGSNLSNAAEAEAKDIYDLLASGE